MAVWVVRQDAPKWGAWDKIALENGVVVIDFGLETDISNFRDRRAMEDYLRQNAHALYGYRSGPPRRCDMQRDRCGGSTIALNLEIWRSITFGSTKDWSE